MSERRQTGRGTVAKAIIGIAVLTPALLLLVVFIVRSSGHTVAWSKSLVQVVFVVDAALLGLGLLLHRGEDL